MSGFIIDLNLHGPYFSLGELKDTVRSTIAQQILYIAREKGSNKAGSDVSYIGITGQEDLGARFAGHHTLGTNEKASSFDDIWVGYLHRPKYPNAPAGRSDRRLKTLEDIMISYFLPPFNTAGIYRKGKDEVGTGSYFSAHIYFHWWTKSQNPRKRAGIAGFPKQINYSKNRSVDKDFDWMEAIY